MMSIWVADICQAVLLKQFFLLFLNYFISFYDLVIFVLFTVKKQILSPNVSPKTNKQKIHMGDGIYNGLMVFCILFMLESLRKENPLI